MIIIVIIYHVHHQITLLMHQLLHLNKHSLETNKTKILMLCIVAQKDSTKRESERERQCLKHLAAASTAHVEEED